MNYILLAESNPDILKLEATALKYFYGGSIIMATNSAEAIEALKVNGRPELLFVDLSIIKENEGALHTYLHENKAIFPVIASSDSPEANEEIKVYQAISGLLEKPVSVDAFTYLVKGMILSPVVSPSHIPIDVKTVLDLACNSIDLFIKLSGTNYVKIISKNDEFSYLDAQKLMSKGIKELHILSSESQELLKAWEKSLRYNWIGSTLGDEENISLVIEALESVEKISKALGWNKEVVVSAQKTVSMAIHTLSKDVKIAEALKKRLSNRTSNYSLHVGMLSFISCAFCIQLGLTGESGQLKLVMASLLHDLALEDEYYQNIKIWNLKAANPQDKSPETSKYRLHPIHASKLAQGLDVLPPDVDQIILQHHEKKDGSGFPRSLNSSRISHLATLFIMSEDLVDFIGNGEHLGTSLTDYITWGQAYYDQGSFKKIFEKIKANITI